MQNYGKKTAIFFLAATLACTTLTPVTAYAAEETVSAHEASANADDTELLTDENISQPSEDTSLEEGDSSKNTIVADDSSDGAAASDKKKVSYAEKTLTVTKAKFVADTFNGVEAIYRPGSNDGSNATYSCAAFIKKYYKEIYDVSVYNLFGGSTPRTYDGRKFSSVSTPKVGDIAYRNGHWSIVKKVAGKNVVLIEQNWKWQQNGKTVCKTNRTVSTDSLTYYRLK